jgi:hypothetical protein
MGLLVLRIMLKGGGASPMIGWVTGLRIAGRRVLFISLLLMVETLLTKLGRADSKPN